MKKKFFIVPILCFSFYAQVEVTSAQPKLGYTGLHRLGTTHSDEKFLEHRNVNPHYDIFCDKDGKPDSSAFSIINYGNTFNTEHAVDPLDSLADQFASSFLINLRLLRSNPQGEYYLSQNNKWSRFLAKLGIPEDLYKHLGNNSNPAENAQLSKILRKKLSKIDPVQCDQYESWFRGRKGCASMNLSFTNGDIINVANFAKLNGDQKHPSGLPKKVYLKGPSGNTDLCSTN